METAWTSAPSYGFRPFVRNLLIKLDKICQPTSGATHTSRQSPEPGFTASRSSLLGTRQGSGQRIDGLPRRASGWLEGQPRHLGIPQEPCNIKREKLQVRTE